MTTYFTSDLHLGHPRVAEIRGFDSVEQHDRWAGEVLASARAGDRVFVLGDYVGRDRDLEAALAPVSLMRARGIDVHLVAGNHDPCHPCRSESLRYERAYLRVFQSVAPYRVVRLEGKRVHLSHFPYNIPDGHADRDPDDVRWPEWRLQDMGHPLLHGHLHTEVKEHGHQYHVGIDAHRALVPESTIAAWLRSLNQSEVKA